MFPDEPIKHKVDDKTTKEALEQLKQNIFNKVPTKPKDITVTVDITKLDI